MRLRLHARDRVDFEDFVSARGAALQQAAWLLTNDLHLAQDLVQTALVDAWGRWAKLGGPGHDPEAYVRRAMYSTYVSWWRRRSFSEKALPRADQDDHVSRSPATPVDVGQQAADTVAVSAALKVLSPQQRAVIVLRFFDDCTIEQTANVLGMSTSAAATHQTRALARLRASGLLVEEEMCRD